MPLLLVLLCGVFATGQDFTLRIDRPVPDLHTGSAFEKALDRGMSMNWSNAVLRSVLERLGTEQKIAIVRDRRIDPDRKLSFSISQQPGRAALRELARAIGAQVSFVDNTVYLGPQPAVQKLRTLIELRSLELSEAQPPIKKFWRERLGKPQNIHWNDLDRPADIVRGIAKHYQLRVFGLQRVPHDLWVGATIPAADAATALSLILIQFDLTFAWLDDATTIEIVPLPEAVALSRTYSPRPKTADAAIRDWKREIPGLNARADGNAVVVVGTLEQHEAVAAQKHPRRSTPSADPAPLERQRITLRIMGIPANKLMADLEKRFQLKFTYDAQAFKKAGIDLGQKIDIDVQAVTIDEYLEAIFSQLGVEMKREGVRVVIGVR